MKGIILCAKGTLAILMVMAAASPVNSFHNGGTGECQGCHIMHNGNSLIPETATNAQKNPSLLKGSDPSSTCLTCHMAPGGTSKPTGYYVATNEADCPPGAPPAQLTPGGDFTWLKKGYSWGADSSTRGNSQAERHGHNIIAAAFNYVVDAKNPVAPQGIYPGDQLSCISCHDPHGRYRRLSDGSIKTTGAPILASGSYNQSPNPDTTGAVGVYRLLGGKGYQPKYLSGGYAFVADPPAAVAPVSYNREESFSDTRVAYGSGMSEWCQNCHSAPKDGGSGGDRHPAGNMKKLSPDVIKSYNSYVSSGNTNGSVATSYTSMVPFEMGTADYAILKKTTNEDGSDRSGPDSGKGGANVMCLSCHRAHASGWDNMTRWNLKSQFLVYKGLYPAIDNGSDEQMAQGRTVLEVLKTFYGRPSTTYAAYQRSLCNKCHMKD